MMLLPPAWVADRSVVVKDPVMQRVEPDMMCVVVVLMEAGLLLVACLILTSVLPYLMFRAGLGSGVPGVRGGGDDESGEFFGGVAPNGESDAGLAGDILRVAMSGRMVWGSGIVGRRGRMGPEKIGLSGL